jgi:hypothetical protein
MSKDQAKISFDRSQKSSYPKKDVFKFEKELSRYPIWIQEFELRNELSSVSEKSEILKKIGLEEFLSEEVRKEFISELAYILRYKRLRDILFDAANRSAKTEKSIGVGFQEVTKNIGTKAQMDTLINYSLDTPHILYHILKNNGFTDKYSSEENKNQNFRLDKGRIFVGFVVKNKSIFGSDDSEGVRVYIDQDGKFVSGNENYVPLGIGIKNLKKNIFSFTSKYNKKNEIELGEIKQNRTNVAENTKLQDKDAEKYYIANTVGVVGLSALVGWWAWVPALIGAGVWTGLKFMTDKHGLPEWKIDNYLLKLVPNQEISDKLHKEIFIYFRQKTNEDKEPEYASYKLICKNKSRPNRKTIMDISKEFGEKMGGKMEGKTRKNNNRMRTTRKI